MHTVHTYECIHGTTWLKILRRILENLWKTGSHLGSNRGPLTLAVSALPPEPWPPGDSQPSQFSLSPCVCTCTCIYVHCKIVFWPECCFYLIILTFGCLQAACLVQPQVYMYMYMYMYLHCAEVLRVHVHVHVHMHSQCTTRPTHFSLCSLFKRLKK